MYFMFLGNLRGFVGAEYSAEYGRGVKLKIDMLKHIPGMRLNMPIGLVITPPPPFSIAGDENPHKKP